MRQQASANSQPASNAKRQNEPHEQRVKIPEVAQLYVELRAKNNYQAISEHQVKSEIAQAAKEINPQRRQQLVDLDNLLKCKDPNKLAMLWQEVGRIIDKVEQSAEIQPPSHGGPK